MTAGNSVTRDHLQSALALHFLSEGFQSPDAAWEERFRALIPGAAAVAPSMPAFSAGNLAPEHFRLFGPAPACPQELTLHLAENPFEQARMMAHMAGFYRAFGLDPTPGERPDNLAVALSFLSFLCLKERNAAEKGLTEAREVTANAVADFTREFLAPGVAAFSVKLATQTSDPFYLALTEMLRRELFSIHSPVVEPASRWEPRPDDDKEGDELTCGPFKQPLPR